MLFGRTKVKVYETTVLEIGKEARNFEEIKMAILFGQNAPDALRDSCYIIEVNDVAATIKAGMTLRIDDVDYKITAVGNEVQTNLQNLGHIAINFTGDKQATLPGSMYVEAKDYPRIEVGSKVAIIK
ncbi:PTS sorbitol transporter subunit IIA [Ligilactobacillus agilis]|uniref:PTS sorbitol transporter subunit IIA n=1 Tax=Ligilactobacillus agilis TaxID=1601 RepID=A0A231QP03_9LACO|nr:PTS glucitol/sorbitol transporter subunit IIA [Ligilactobacillus agilis]OXC08694.1 PTS sorbitol transporter subunit IIA [Ligilactobacillus agilis]OXC09952.1 PTS sorbitol transporter subunit IIA [Ligilactobacillus agilis]OXC12627.1 PTS sorbitol transporter subunit IIA [Ligilactobacillus agilis]OXS38311.1 PTS sorbitol transporter subunit IIA [Ligilactobacillus agilis]OXS42260.1 PTS sorbitol transporter subunit IIA [Ligilactobacillus agilis]